MRMPFVAAVAFVALACLPVAAALAVPAFDLGAEAEARPQVAPPAPPPDLAPRLEPPSVPQAPSAGTLDPLVEVPDVSVDLPAAGADVSADVELDIAPASVGDDGAADEHASSALAAVPPEVLDAAPPVLATAGVLAVLQSFGGLRLLGLGAVALYSRLTRSDLLDNDHRDRVYRLVQENPGLGLTEIAERSGLGWGTTVYHLDRLERAQFVASERVGLHRCYFPVGSVSREARKSIGTLKTDATRTIAELVAARPGITQGELCATLGVSASAASKQVTKLEGAGLVRREREWKTVRLYPASDLHALVTTPGPAVAAPGLVASVA